MRAILSLLVIYCFVLNCWGWIGLEANPGDFKGYCEPQTHKVGKLKVGETKRIPGLCAIAECESNGDIKYTGCAPVQVRGKCRILPGDLSKPFPHCCYEIGCDELKNKL